MLIMKDQFKKKINFIWPIEYYSDNFPIVNQPCKYHGKAASLHNENMHIVEMENGCILVVDDWGYIKLGRIPLIRNILP